MPKVAIISLQKYGAGAIDSLELSNSLCRKGVFHYIFIAAGNEVRNKYTDNKYRKVITIKTFESSIVSLLLSTFSIVKPLIFIKNIINVKPQIVHVTHFHVWIIFIYLLKPFLKYKIFYTSHENPFEPKEDFPFLLNALEKFYIKKADLVITHSNFVKYSLLKYIRKRIEVVFLGLYPKMFNIQKKNYFKKDLCLLFLGRIEKYKGIDTLVDAYEVLKSKNYNIRLIIAGKGKIEDSLKEKINKLNIELRNYWLSYEEIEELLNKTDILVAPYKEATQSGVAIFSLAYNIPIIATNVGAFPEYIQNGVNGLLVKPNDPLDLAEKIEILYKNRELLDELTNGIVEKSKEFEWDYLVTKLLNLYEEYISKV